VDGEAFGSERTLFCDDYGAAFVHERGGVMKKLNDVYAIGDATCYLTKKNYPASAIFAEKSAKAAAFNAIHGDRKKLLFSPSIYYKTFDMMLRRLKYFI
jgi:NADH dehydrogenase FAD-containing subunit